MPPTPNSIGYFFCLGALLAFLVSPNSIGRPQLISESLADSRVRSVAEPAGLFQGNTYRSEVVAIVREVRPKPDLRLLEKFFEEVPRIPEKRALEQKAGALSDYIFNKWNLRADTTYLARENRDNILPDSVLRGKKGHCLGLTALFLLAAEKAGFPAYLVRGPDHVFPRLCAHGKCINVEMLENGAIRPDSYYVTRLSIPRTALESKLYLQSLENPRELAGSIYLGLGYIANTAGQNDLAELFYVRASEKSPDFAEVYSNLASIKAKKGEQQEVLGLLNKALSLNPTHYATAVNLGVIHHNKKNFPEALKFYNLALESNPLSVQAYRRRSVLYRERGDKKAALVDLERILIIQPRFCDVREERQSLLAALGRASKDTELTRLKNENLCQLLPP